MHKFRLQAAAPTSSESGVRSLSGFLRVLASVMLAAQQPCGLKAQICAAAERCAVNPGS